MLHKLLRVGIETRVPSVRISASETNAVQEIRHDGTATVYPARPAELSSRYRRARGQRFADRTCWRWSCGERAPGAKHWSATPAHVAPGSAPSVPRCSHASQVAASPSDSERVPGTISLVSTGRCQAENDSWAFTVTRSWGRSRTDFRGRMVAAWWPGGCPACCLTLRSYPEGIVASCRDLTFRL
jgi:hypothetical protein